MLSLSPAKILVILVVALIVLGPDKLPQMARQLGAFWHDFRTWRGRIESEVRDSFPNLPPTHEVARVVRSPLAFLDRLADEHERNLEEAEADDGSAVDDDDHSPSPVEPAVGESPPAATTAPPATTGITANGAAPRVTASPAANGASGANGSTRAANGAAPHADQDVVAADDPSMN